MRANAASPEHYALLARLGLRSLIVVPLRVRGATIALMSFATAESGRRYDHADLLVAEELARRAAMLLDHAQLLRELQASDRRFRVALSIARTAVFEQDRELRYRWGYEVPRDRGSDADLIPKQVCEATREVAQRVLATGEPVRSELRIVGNQGERVAKVAIEPLHDAAGAIVGVIGATTDITDEKRAQDELAQAVAFREELMGILGHDLRNPLGAILAATGLLGRRDDLAPPVRDRLAGIERAARRMAELIGTVLDFTQVRFHGLLPVAPVATDLADVARAVVDELRAANPGRRIELSLRADARGQWDPVRLGQVVSNLVGNALVHGSAAAPIDVIIDGDDDDVRLHVHNRGGAIAPEQRAALFEPFRRGAGARRGSSDSGLGLGLYIVRQIARAHHGDVAVASSDADGTTFTVTLPRRLRPGDCAPAHDAASGVPG